MRVGGFASAPLETDPESVLAATLAWAAERNIPFDEALLTIHGPLRVGCQVATVQLKRGKSLAAALKTGLGRRLSPNFLRTLARAELDGELPSVLPHLASTIQLSAGLRRERRISLFYPMLQFSVIATIIGLLLFFIMPKFLQIFDGLIEHERISTGMLFLSYIGGNIACMSYIEIGYILMSLILLATLISIVNNYCNEKNVILRVVVGLVASIVETTIIVKYGMLRYGYGYSYHDDGMFYVFFLVIGLFFMHVVIINVITTRKLFSRYLWILAPGVLITSLGWLDIIDMEFIMQLFVILASFLCPILIITSFLRFLWGIASSCIGTRPWFLPLPIKGFGIFPLLPVSDLSSGMYVHLASGKGIAESAELCRDTVARPWLRRRLDRFIVEVRAGEPWADAWARMKLGSPLHEWMIRNAAARENPAEGFSQLTAWLNEEIRRKHRLFLRFAEVAGILFNAALVALFVLGMFEVLVDTIRLLSLETY
jgi:type II secretory pathway component PulF